MAHYKATAILSWEFQAGDSLEEAEKAARLKFQEWMGHIDPTRYQMQLSLMPCKPKEKIPSGNIQIKSYHPDKILSLVKDSDERVQFEVDNAIYEIKMNSQRYLLFKKCRTCVSCGLHATKMVLETLPDGSNPHFNLYGVEDDGLILFTKDHRKPRAFGGTDTMDNYEVMCAPCNQLKASYNLSYDSVKVLREFAREHRHLPRKELNRLLSEQRLLMLDCLNGQ